MLRRLHARDRHWHGSLRPSRCVDAVSLARLRAVRATDDRQRHHHRADPIRERPHRRPARPWTRGVPRRGEAAPLRPRHLTAQRDGAPSTPSFKWNITIVWLMRSHEYRGVAHGTLTDVGVAESYRFDVR